MVHIGIEMKQTHADSLAFGVIHLGPLIIRVLLVTRVKFGEELPVLVRCLIVLPLDDNDQVTLDTLA